MKTITIHCIMHDIFINISYDDDDDDYEDIEYYDNDAGKHSASKRRIGAALSHSSHACHPRSLSACPPCRAGPAHLCGCLYVEVLAHGWLADGTPDDGRAYRNS
eukprot:GHVU01097176.1.p2 GENE.GHVU01097176.1~~GHVU01097176.1.p2  ORF type:complete len:104 (-),score=6.44 GHVU01097176.1:218-529(-)